MAANTKPVFEKDPYSKSSTFTNSTTANTNQDLVPAADVPTEGLRIDEISLTSTETANARVVSFWDHDGTTAFLIGSVNVPVNSGFDGSAPIIDAIPLLAPSTGYITLMTGHKLQIAVTTQPASGKTVTVTARGGKLTA
jgi:hypothetical protein